jgi:hypothetical protein
MAGPETSSEVRRCPTCGARNRGTGVWCTLCHADLAGPPPVAAEEPVEPVEPIEPIEPADGDAPAGPVFGTKPAGEVDPRLVQQLLVQLQVQESGIKLPGRLSVLHGLLEPGAPKGRAIAVAAGAAVVVAVLVIVLFAVVGLAL